MIIKPRELYGIPLFWQHPCFTKFYCCRREPFWRKFGQGGYPADSGTKNAPLPPTMPIGMVGNPPQIGQANICLPTELVGKCCRAWTAEKGRRGCAVSVWYTPDIVRVSPLICSVFGYPLRYRAESRLFAVFCHYCTKTPVHFCEQFTPFPR